MGVTIYSARQGLRLMNKLGLDKGHNFLKFLLAFTCTDPSLKSVYSIRKQLVFPLE